MKRKIRKTFSALLAFVLLVNLLSVGVSAADTGQEPGNSEENASVQTDDAEITGDGPMGDMLADVLSEEQARTEEVNISSLTFDGQTAAVTYSASGVPQECDLVVAVYADGQEPGQMLASGTISVPGGY